MFRLVVLFAVVAVAAAAPGYLHTVPVASSQYERNVAQGSPEYIASYPEDAVHGHNAVDLHDVQYDDAHIYEDDAHLYANAHELESKPFAEETVHNIHHVEPEAVAVHNIQQIHHEAPVVVEDAHYTTALAHDVQQLHNLPADTHHLSVQDVVDPIVHSVESLESYHAVHTVHGSPVQAVEDAHIRAPVIDDVALPPVHSVATSNHHGFYQVHGNPVEQSLPVQAAEDSYLVSAPLVAETPVIHNARTVIHAVDDVALPTVHSVAASNHHAIHQVHDTPIIHSVPAQTAGDCYLVSAPLVAEAPVIHNAPRTVIHAVEDVALPSVHSVAANNHHAIQQVHNSPVIHSDPAQAAEDTYIVSAPLVAETSVIHDAPHTVIHAVDDVALPSVHSIATSSHQSLHQVHDAPVPSFHSLEVAPLVAPPLATSDIRSESSSSVQHSISAPGVHVASSHSVHEVRKTPAVLGHAVHAAVPVAVSHSARTDVHQTSSVVAAPVVGHLHGVHVW